MQAYQKLIAEVRACRLCADLPLGPKPIVQLDPRAKILIAGQAPGRITHEKGIPFDDPSGDRLRSWLGIDRATFYDPARIAILPMALCFPGGGKNGDLPPRAACAPAWRAQLLAALPNLQLSLLIGAYAQAWHLPGRRGSTLTETVAGWQAFWPDIMPLPHPSPRNRGWPKKNPWFETDLLPALRARVATLLQT
ncbi:MAG: uracil-DNA glycosylase family protein [Alphaproteobacteria bacterium]|nr:MAG: uracil-DNA glycosylase family protein [Alphaproteobacteria bacterium]